MGTLCWYNKCGNQHLPSTYDDAKYNLVKYWFNSTYEVWDLHSDGVTPKTNEGINIPISIQLGVDWKFRSRICKVNM